MTHVADSAADSAADAPAGCPPLSRNLNYLLLWSSQAISQLGSAASTMAFPLLVLMTTGSALNAGMVGFANAAARFVTGLPAGTLVDRWDRKRIMLTSEVIRAAALGGLVVALVAHLASFGLILVVAVAEGVFATLFAPAEDATVASVVPAEQLSKAVAGNAARSYVGAMLGPIVGGFLIGIARTLPFLVDAVSYAASFAGVLFLRTPRREPAANVHRGLAREMLVGLQWVVRRPAIRATFLCVVAFNLMCEVLLFLVIVVSNARGVPPGQIGIMVTMLGCGGLAGAFVAPALRSVLGTHRSIAAMAWVFALATPLLAVVPAGFAFGGLLAAMAFLTPTATASVQAYQIRSTPDELRGRLSGANRLFGGIAGALGPLVGGALISLATPAAAILGCAAALVVLALAVTVSPTLRGLTEPD